MAEYNQDQQTHVNPSDSGEVRQIILRVNDIPPDFYEILEIWLESPKKGGGEIKSFQYYEKENAALVTFADNRGKCLSEDQDNFAGHIATSVE